MTAGQVVGVASALTVAVLVIAVIAVSWALAARRTDAAITAITPADPVDVHAATTPTVSACLCDPPGCHARPCLTYEKEHAYR